MISLNIPGKFSIQYLNNIILKIRNIFKNKNKNTRKDYYRNDLKPKDYEKMAKKAGFVKTKIVNVCPFPIFTSIKINTDKKITKVYKNILKFKKIFQSYPYKTNYIASQGHFLIAYKK